MNSMLCLGHFCEVHGPTSIMCTQALTSSCARAEIDAMSNVSGASSSSSPSRHVSTTCQSCEFLIPKSAAMGTSPSCIKSGIANDLVAVSSHYPAAQSRYTALRQICLRMLSSEHTFSDSTPMMFSDNTIGTAIVVVFAVSDEVSRGHVRRYGIACVCENETALVRAWHNVAPQLVQIAKSIQRRATHQSSKQVASFTGPERYLRMRDVQQPSRSLASILNDDHIFIEIHMRFSKILSGLGQ
jgi:hypothetical protein